MQIILFFATALSNTVVANGTDGYTVFALPDDSIIIFDGETISTINVQWHVVHGKYTVAQLLQAQNLQTIGDRR